MPVLLIDPMTRGSHFLWAFASFFFARARVCLYSIALALALPANLHAACTTTVNVKKTGGGDYTSIQTAVDAIPATLTGNYCVNVDSTVYSEQVTIQGKNTTAAYRITIQSDPAMVSTATPINPPVGSTAAFHILNASVTIAGFNVTSTNTVTYGVYASSAYITISSVNVQDATGKISDAGVSLSSWNTVNYSSVTVKSANGYLLVGSTKTTISFSTAATATYVGITLDGASSNTITHSYIYSENDAIGFGNTSDNNTISFTTATSANGSAVLYLDNSSSNTITNSYFASTGNAFGMVLSQGAGNSISESTFYSNFVDGVALNGSASTANIITKSFIIAPYGYALDNDGKFGLITFSTMSSNYETGLALNAGSSNTYVGCYMANPSGSAIAFAGSYSTVSLSTITSNSMKETVRFTGSRNTLSQDLIVNNSGIGVKFRSFSIRSSIVLSTVVSNGVDAAAIYLERVSSMTLDSNYIQGSTGVYISGSTGTVIMSNVIVATNTTGDAIWVGTGIVNVSITSTTLIVPSGGRGVAFNVGSRGSLSLSSVAVSGASYGLFITTQTTGASLTISSMTFRNLASGATAIYFTGGTFVSTFTSITFEDSTIGSNINASRLDPTSRITFNDPAGIRRGPKYENDPLSVVDWNITPIAGCNSAS
jgi:hypothetical protein